MNGELMWKLRFSIGDDAGEFGISADLALDFGLGAHALNPRTGAQRRHFEHQGIAGNDGPAEPGLFDSREQDQLLITILDFAQSENGAALSHRLNHQNARHDRSTGKVALKIFFVDADLFDADDTLARNELDYAVDEEEGIAMRQKFLDAFSVENCFHENWRQNPDWSG